MEGTFVFVLRVALGGILVWASLHKVRAPREFVEGVARYQLLPAALVPYAATGVIVAEAGAGLLLLAGIALPVAFVASSALFALFTGALGVNLMRDRRVPCFCFGGDPGEAISLASLARATLLLALSLLGAALVLRTAVGSVPPRQVAPALTLAASAVIVIRLIGALPDAWRAFRSPAYVSPTSTVRISFRDAPPTFSLSQSSGSRMGPDRP